MESETRGELPPFHSNYAAVTGMTRDLGISDLSSDEPVGGPTSGSDTRSKTDYTESGVQSQAVACNVWEWRQQAEG